VGVTLEGGVCGSGMGGAWEGVMCGSGTGGWGVWEWHWRVV